MMHMTNPERDGMSVILEIKVVPSSGRQALVVDPGGALIKVYLKSPPEAGKANRELVSFLAKSLGCTLGQVTLVSGAASRTKRVKIDLALTREEVLSKLGFAVQTRLFG
jgi:uncharacterized protein